MYEIKFLFLVLLFSAAVIFGVEFLLFKDRIRSAQELRNKEQELKLEIDQSFTGDKIYASRLSGAD